MIECFDYNRDHIINEQDIKQMINTADKGRLKKKNKAKDNK